MGDRPDSFDSHSGPSHFRIIADASSDAIVTIDEGSIVVFANAAVQRIFGYSPDELIGGSLTLLIPAPLRPVHERSLRRYLETGERHISWGGIELPAVHRSGTELVVEVSFGEFKMEGRSFFTGVIRDITDRKRSEARRKIEAAVMRVLAESIATSEIPTEVLKVVCTHLTWQVGELWTLVPVTREMRCAATWHEATPELKDFVEAGRAFTFAPGIGLPGRVLMSGAPHWIRDLAEDPNFPRKAIALAAGLCSGLAFPIRAAGTIVAVMEFFSAEVRDPDNELMDMLSAIGTQVGQFIERRRAEEEREVLLVREQNARAEAERASRLKDEFLTSVSHELRTPMTAIVGWTDLIRRGALDVDRQREAIEIIHRNATTQTRLVNDLLDLSAIITGKVRLSVQPLYIASGVQAAIDSIMPAVEAKGIRIQITLDPHAGPVSGDADRIQQVVWNLLSNAVKFTPKHGRVQVILERLNSHIELRVSDTGVGIAEEFLPYVFDRFRQADASSTREHPGMGIGLAIVRHLVELHGGTIGVSSPGKGKGTTFVVRLPVRILHDPVDPPVAELPSFAPRTAVVGELQNFRVLVVDDHAETANLIQVILETRGAGVTTASSAREALELLPTAQPHILISDIGMAGEDGYALIGNVRKLQSPHRHIPALALTAYAREEDRTRALWAGYDAHLAKPVSAESLVAVVATLARRASLNFGSRDSGD